MPTTINRGQMIKVRNLLCLLFDFNSFIFQATIMFAFQEVEPTACGYPLFTGKRLLLFKEILVH